jgi:hypothetical protein
MLARLQRAFDLLRHLVGNKPGRFADRAAGSIVIGFLVLWLGVRALRRRLRRLLAL